jgi:hypothetical protein
MCGIVLGLGFWWRSCGGSLHGQAPVTHYKRQSKLTCRCRCRISFSINYFGELPCFSSFWRLSIQNWPTGIYVLESKITRNTEVTFLRTVIEKVYCIGAIGFHGCYGKAEMDGHVIRALTDWHDTILNQGSYLALQQLVVLLKAYTVLLTWY